MSAAVIELADRSGLLKAVGEQTYGDQPWCQAVQRAIDPGGGARAHLAVMREPYLTYILAGRKTIESRFSRHQIAPYGHVRNGDVLLFKALGGPVTALALVAGVDYYRLDPELWESLRQRFTAALAAEDEAFWTDRRHARYATLMRIGAVRQLAPISVDKRDRRGWVVLDSHRVHPDQLSLVGEDSYVQASKPSQSADRHLRDGCGASVTTPRLWIE
jgi:hypothetical protein